MKLPRVYPILDSESLLSRGLTVISAARALLDGGARILQIRHKGHWDRNVYESARILARMCSEAGAIFVINDRADFALLLDAALHVGQEDLPPQDARKLIGAERMLGYSTHNAAQLQASAALPVDYIALGPIFGTGTKRNPDPVVGLEELRRCRALIDKPLVAIGGITLQHAASVLEAGADSVAVIAGLMPLNSTARTLREGMEEWRETLDRVATKHAGGPPPI
jgi:thiamine-phosphate pyrophosphorylase